MWPSASWHNVGTLIAIISQLNTRPACAPVNASMAALRLTTHDSGSGWFATPFLYDSLIHHSTPVYPGAHHGLLGNRSVFANPADSYACDNLSSYLKKRPAYFAYAVAMNDEDRGANPQSPYLSRSTNLPEYFGDSPVRMQTVSKSVVPVLHQLLGVFQKRTGVRALLNTSLNYFDEPIACTPRDALKTFYASGLDMLVMENFVLTKS